MEFDEPIGKNDGSIDGARYFRCKPNHGMFITPSKVFRDEFPQSTIRKSRVNTYDSSTATRRRKITDFRISNLNTGTSSPRTPDLILTVGMSVLYLVQRETGVVRYIGPAEIGDGLWIGVEFNRPIAKSDSKAKDYFKCKPNFGMLLRPSKVTYRGINCLKILPVQPNN